MIQGLAQAIGFSAAGTIFVARRDVKNLTTAAGIWLAASAGIVAGATRFTLPAAAVGFGFGLLVLLKLLAWFGLPQKDRRRIPAASAPSPRASGTSGPCR
ncbi:MgtC/SapB family protein [Methylobacterium oxalidis]|uniref:MgtC/SapB/SrpB/YhiD N-terminal domain-containing protein n=1 Tax=Methylobacterium oxalidis TaxID=944322 RepID=A0ABQ6DQP6_9HYPH|nr:MgtC/SapB family protein [Methylobacterium oxalidis]GLS66463.1 hypothetical protein GCM10007888_48460 [Methylobacterium oxalidis]